MDAVLVGLSLVSIASPLVFPTLRLGSHIASPSLTPTVSLSLTQCERANNSPEQPIKSPIPAGLHSIPQTAVDYFPRRLSDRFLPNVIDLVNDAVRRLTSVSGAS